MKRYILSVIIKIAVIIFIILLVLLWSGVHMSNSPIFGQFIICDTLVMLICIILDDFLKRAEDDKDEPRDIFFED